MTPFIERLQPSAQPDGFYSTETHFYLPSGVRTATGRRCEKWLRAGIS
jgi:hypothetical protein